MLIAKNGELWKQYISLRGASSTSCDHAGSGAKGDGSDCKRQACKRSKSEFHAMMR